MPSFPLAQQAQIIRANQRDIFHLSSLKDQAEGVLRSWFGTRWLSRWDKEVDLLVKLGYFGVTTGRATQTLGEEYTDIWQHSGSQQITPPHQIRVALVILSCLPNYVIAKWSHSTILIDKYPSLAKWLKRIQTGLEVATEINLGVFYVRGVYYDLIKRVLGVEYLSSLPENPHTRPPSYSLLGILILIKLLYRLRSSLRNNLSVPRDTVKGKMPQVSGFSGLYIDDESISTLVTSDMEVNAMKSAEQDERTALDVTMIPSSLRTSRSCTLCLEERTDSCTTECGHLFCWNCIVGWGREKAECPLCRQSLNLARLLPIYNL